MLLTEEAVEEAVRKQGSHCSAVEDDDWRQQRQLQYLGTVVPEEAAAG